MAEVARNSPREQCNDLAIEDVHAGVDQHGPRGSRLLLSERPHPALLVALHDALVFGRLGFVRRKGGRRFVLCASNIRSSDSPMQTSP